MHQHDLDLLTEACSRLPPPKGNYLYDDYVLNLMLSVLDFNRHTTQVERAVAFFRRERWHELRTYDQLVALLAKYPDSKEGNEQLARHLWNYREWTKAGLLRRLIDFFGNQGITTQAALAQWARSSEFKRDFKGRIRGADIAVYNWLVMRVGVETVKPDVHVIRFVETMLQRAVPAIEAVELLEEVARRLGWKAYELDWRIWEQGRREGSKRQSTPRLQIESPTAGATTSRPRRGKWTDFYGWLNEQFKRNPSITLSVDEIIARTGTKDSSVTTRGFWLLNQRGAKDYDGFVRAGIEIDFRPDTAGVAVQDVTFRPH